MRRDQRRIGVVGAARGLADAVVGGIFGAPRRRRARLEAALARAEDAAAVYPDISRHGRSALGLGLGAMVDADARMHERLARGLAESEERQRLVLGSLPDTIVAVYDRELRLLLLDGGAIARAGIDPAAFLGRPIEETLPAEQFASLRPAVLRALEGETTRGLEYHSTASELVYELDIAPYRAADGTITGAFAVGRDVSERRRSERESRERERMLAASQARTHIGSWELDEASGRLLWSDELCRIAGRPLGFSPTVTEFLALVHPEDRDRLSARVEEAQAGAASESEYRILRPDGEIRHVRTWRTLEEGPRTGTRRLVGTTQDVTDRVGRDREIERLVRIVEQSSEAITSKDLEGTITGWNAGAERLYGYRASEAIGQPISLIVPRERRGEDAVLLERALAEGGVQQFETVRVRKDGTNIDVALTLSAIRDAHGEPVGVSVITRDVTARRQAERERERALSGLAEAQRLARVGSWTWDTVADEATWSEEMYRLFGRDPREGPATSDAFLAYLHPEDRARVAEGYRDTFGGGAGFELDYRIVAGDGTERTLHALGRQDGQDPTCYSGTVQDVTALREAERAARAAEQRFRGTLESAPIGIALVAPDGRWLLVNRALCAIVGYSESELLELTFQDITHPDDLETDLEHVRALLAGEVSGYRMQKRYLHKSGRVVWIELSVSLMRDEQGQPAHFISQIQDITVQRAAVEALAESERRYESIAANVPGMVYRYAISPDGTRSAPFVSAGCGEIYGVSPEEFRADPDLARRITDPQDLDAVDSSIAHSAASLAPWDHRWRIRTPAGELKHLHAVSRPFREPDGTVVWDGIVLDETEVVAARAREAETRQRLQLVLENLAGSAVVLYDREHRMRFCEGPLFAHFDLTAMLGQRLEAVARPDTVAMMIPRLERALAGETSAAVLDADWDGRTLAVQFVPYRMADGTIDGTLVHWHDITAVRQAERERDEALERFQIAFERAPIGMVIVGLDGRFEQVNDALCEMTGYAPEDLLSMAPFAIVHPEDLEHVQQEFAQVGATPSITVEHRIAHAHGHVVWAQARVTMIRDEHGQPVHVLAQVQDITERRSYEERLKHLADHDPLTGLLNRRGLESTLDGHLARCRRYGATGALLVLDLDGFKFVNDTLGHAVGDELIINTAHALTSRLRETDSVARLGGDEFAVLLPEQDQREACRVAQTLLETIREHAAAMSGSHPGRVTASIGIAPFTDPEMTADEMLVNADLAMYEAKEAGKNQYALFAQNGHQMPRVKAQMTWLERIEQALERERFVLHAQPIFDLHTQRPIQHEILVRMLDEHGDLIPPATFLYIAERFGTIRALDQWILTHAIQAMSAHQSIHARPLPLAVNISGLSAGDEDLLDTISRALRTHQVSAADLTLEITETAAVADIPRARRFADALKDIGCQFALDDFGAGFGSFYYLKHLPFDTVKVDGEFVRHATENHADRLVIKAVTEIAHGLGKQTIAEHVPDEHTIRLLLRHGVDLGQGHYLGRPRPLDDLIIRPDTNAPAQECS